MKLRFAVFCDHASMDARGKVSLIGVFSRVFTQVLPIAIPVHVGIGLEMERSEAAVTHKLRMTLEDPRKEIISWLEADIQNEEIPSDGPDSGEALLAVPLGIVAFKMFGRHTLSVVVDGAKTGESHLNVTPLLEIDKK